MPMVAFVRLGWRRVKLLNLFLFKAKMTEKTGLDLMRVAFPPNQISKLPKPLKRDAVKGQCAECGGYHGLPAIHLDYVGHAALTDRLLDCDPNWTWEPLAMDAGLPVMDPFGGMWIRLTVCGVTRLGYGHAGDKAGGDAIKEIIGDALRNAAMRFGAALDLWHKGDLHVENNEETRTEWIAARVAEINSAKTAGEMKRILEDAITITQQKGDHDAESQLREAAIEKVKQAKEKA